MLSMQRLHSELYWWWVLVKSEDDLAGWRRHLGSRPLAQEANPDPDPEPRTPNP